MDKIDYNDPNLDDDKIKELGLIRTDCVHCGYLNVLTNDDIVGSRFDHVENYFPSPEVLSKVATHNIYNCQSCKKDFYIELDYPGKHNILVTWFKKLFNYKK